VFFVVTVFLFGSIAVADSKSRFMLFCLYQPSFFINTLSLGTLFWM